MSYSVHILSYLLRAPALPVGVLRHLALWHGDRRQRRRRVAADDDAAEAGALSLVRLAAEDAVLEHSVEAHDLGSADV